MRTCYKYCVVPLCKNNTKNAPEKAYFHVPRDAHVRKKWCKAMRRDCGSNKSSLFCCEEHFNIEKDTENYMEYKIMTLEKGQKRKLRLRKDIVPYIFQCQKREKLKKINPSPVPGHDEAVMEHEVFKVCRACLGIGVTMIDVAAARLQDTFEHATRTKLNSSDERPTQVCFECCSQLQRFQAFCQMSGRAEAYMTQLLKKGLQITEQAVSKLHHLIKPKLDVTMNPLFAIHTQEDSNECDSVEVKVEVINDEPDYNRSFFETEKKAEIGNEFETEIYITERNPERENKTEERLLEFETEGEIKIDLEEVDIEEPHPFEAVEHTRDEACYYLQCTETFPLQSELLKKIKNHTHRKPKQKANTRRTRRNVKGRINISERENLREESPPDLETKKEIKIIEHSDAFNTFVRDEAYYNSLPCAIAFSQIEIINHVQNTKKKLKKANRRNVQIGSRCKFCNMKFAINTQLMTHVATEHGFGEFSETQKPKRRKPNILKKHTKLNVY